ncbi:MAG: acyl-CoA dehydrogenase [Porticoccaceae bacterium]|nr:MAG: acyl-CoA dehydrogenase [Porticoccaceae bacterium]
MDLRYTATEQAFREEARAWLAAHVPRDPLPSPDTAEGFAAHRLWEQRLAEARWSAVTWPAQYGGRGATLVEWLIFEEEYYRAGAPVRINANGLHLLAPTLLEHGTPEQKARFLPPMAKGEEVWAQAWSEPEAGSDLAALRCRAVRDGDHYVLSGQKTWSTRAAFADWCFGLFRTGSLGERHRGLTFLLVSLRSPGVRVRPIRQLDGRAGFAEIFFDEVKVPVSQRVGEEGEGWKVAMATAGFERGLLLRSPARFQERARRLVELWRRRRDQLARDPHLEDAVVQAWLDAEAYCLATYHTACRLDRGGVIGPEASTNKIFWSELDLLLCDAALRILGPAAEFPAGKEVLAKEADSGRWLEEFLFAQAGPIYAGTNEIQRNIIAERLLGLPR